MIVFTKNIPHVVFFSLFFLPFKSAYALEELEIIDSEQKIEFYVDEQTLSLHAKLTVKQQFKSNSSVPVACRQVVSFDDNTRVQKFRFKRNNKKNWKYLLPILKDYEADGIFHNDIRLAIIEKDILRKGETMELEYEKIFTDTRFLTSLYFQQTHFIQNSIIKIVVPDWLRLRIEELNFDKNYITLKKEEENKLTIYEYTQKKVSQPTEDKNAPSKAAIAPHLILVVNAFQNHIREIIYTESIKDLYAWYASLVHQVDNQTAAFKDLVEDLTRDETSDLDKIASIYFWVQDNIRYIAFEDGINGFKPESCQSVYTNRYGDCKGMANLVKEMLLLAGYDARLTWLGTRDIPYTYDIPSLVVDNHMICTVFLNGKKIFLDPTQKFTGLTEYSYQIQEQEVLIEDGGKFILDKIPLSTAGHYFRKSKEFLEIEGTQLVGHGTATLEGSARIELANALSRIEKKKQVDIVTDFISSNSEEVDLTLLPVHDWGKRDVPLELSYQIKLNNQITDIGEEIYLNIEKDKNFLQSTIPSSRKVAFVFPDIMSIQSTVEISIPRNSQVVYLPKKITIHHEKYDFELSYQQKDGKIHYQKYLALKDPIIEEVDFKNWNKDIASLKKFYEDQIILQVVTE